jgi:hypothetical protein
MSMVHVNIADSYTDSLDGKQQGGFVDLVQPLVKKSMFGFEKAVLNAAFRAEYVDCNRGFFKSTGGNFG